MKVKKCVIFNYIPHKTPKKSNYNKWYEKYYTHLYSMYKLSNDILKNRYTETENIDFDKFCFLIYKYSSKYIWD
jgi:hypothetical protein